MSKEYNEVIEILNHVPRKDLEKIPDNLINMFKANVDSDYKFKYNTKKTLDEQNVSKEAKTIIAILYRDYWASDEKKKKILAKEKYDKEIIEQKLREKYNSDDIFNNKKPKENINLEKTGIVQYKEKFITKIINAIKRLFKK